MRIELQCNTKAAVAAAARQSRLFQKYFRGIALRRHEIQRADCTDLHYDLITKAIVQGPLLDTSGILMPARSVTD